MRYLSYVLMLVVAFLLQSTFFELIAILDIKPNAILIVIISIALLRGELEGALAGFIGGLLMDTYCSFMGANIFICTFIGYLTGLMSYGLYKENPFVPVTAVFFITFVYEFAYYVINILLQGYTDFSYFFDLIILREMVYNATISLVFYGIVYFVNSLLENKERFKRKLF